MSSSAAPVVRTPYAGWGPRWWQRLALRTKLLCLGARQHTARNDVMLLERELAMYRALLDQAHQPREVQWLQGEVALTSELLSACLRDEAEASEQIAWAKSDLAKLA